MLKAINKISSTKGRGSAINMSNSVAMSNTSNVINQFDFFILFRKLLCQFVYTEES